MSVKSALRRNSGVVVCVLAAMLVTLPLWFIRFAPLHDYPVHVARMAILRDVISGHGLSNFYQINSFLIPNSGMDLLVLSFLKLFGVEFACKLAIILICLIMISGAYFLNSSIFRPNIIVALLAAFLVYNSVFTMGFLNYLMGVGLLLWGVGLFMRGRSLGAGARFALGFIIGLVLLLAHIVALALYAIIIAGLEIQASWPAMRTAPRVAMARLAMSAFPILLVLALFFAFSPTAGAVGNPIVFDGSSPLAMLKYKVWLMRRPLAGAEDNILDYSSTLCALVLVGAAFVLGKVRIAREAILALALLCLVFLAVPDAALSGSFLSFRLPIAIVFVFLGFTEFAISKVRIRAAAVAFLFVVLGIRTAAIAHDWKAYDRVEQQFVDAYRLLPPNSILFAARGNDGSLDSWDPDWQPPIKHFASLAVVTDGTVVPSTAAEPTQWTIRVRPEFADVYKLQKSFPIKFRNAQGLAGFIHDIRSWTRNHPPEPTGRSRWKVYLLLLNPRVLGYPRFAGAGEIAHGRLFTLYRIDDVALSGG